MSENLQVSMDDMVAIFGYNSVADNLADSINSLMEQIDCNKQEHVFRETVKQVIRLIEQGFSPMAIHYEIQTSAYLIRHLRVAFDYSQYQTTQDKLHDLQRIMDNE